MTPSDGSCRSRRAREDIPDGGFARLNTTSPFSTAPGACIRCPVHQVPDALSRLVSPRVANDPRPVVEVDDEIPTFDAGKTVRDVSDELADHVCIPKCNHKAIHVFITTRNQTVRQKKSRARARDGPSGDDDAPALEGPTSFWDENDEFDAADIERAGDHEVGAPNSPVAPLQDCTVGGPATNSGTVRLWQC